MKTGEFHEILAIFTRPSLSPCTHEIDLAHEIIVTLEVTITTQLVQLI